MALIDFLRHKYNQYSPYHRRSVAFREMMEKNDREAYEKMFSDKANIEIYMTSERLDFLNEVVRRAQSHSLISQRSRVIDIGCGTGDLLKILKDKKLGSEFYGLDYAASAENLVKAKDADIKFMCGDLFEIEIRTMFDIVFCTEVLEHVPEPVKFVEKMLSFTHLGGSLVITVPDGRKDTWIGHRNFWSPESFEEFIGSFGRKFMVDYFDNTNFAVVKSL
jgi:2-polyprenyl-3-methyl-5-hydroxy-6-metoxy-1,4-benzoquinol methylase